MSLNNKLVTYEGLKEAVKPYIDSGDSLKIDKTSIVNNLTTNDSTKVLAASVAVTLNNNINTLNTKVDTKEPIITKKTGFNLDKSDEVNSTSQITLATSKAVKTAYDKGVEGLNKANTKLDSTAMAVSSGYLTAHDNRTIKPNGTGITTNVKAVKAFFSSTANVGITNDGSYADLMVFDTYGDATGGCVNALALSKGANGGLYHLQADFASASWKVPDRIYTTKFKPTKTDVGLGNINNWTATSATNDASDSKYATANAVKKAYDHASSAMAKCPYNVGDIFLTTNSGNPSTMWVGTTWEKIEGRFLRGTSGSGASKAVGGSDTKTLAVGNLPAHNHTITGMAISSAGDHYHESGNHRHQVDNHTHTQTAHIHSTSLKGSAGNQAGHNRGAAWGADDWYTPSYHTANTSSAGGDVTGVAAPFTNYQNPNTSTTGSHTHTITGGAISNTGSGTAFDILPSYYTVHMWLRKS